ncbi:Protein of unknown function [Magnetospira sp. QH-2]|nr:Protein of unknown function [Magnetospira sp. QH-2]
MILSEPLKARLEGLERKMGTTRNKWVESLTWNGGKASVHKLFDGWYFRGNWNDPADAVRQARHWMRSAKDPVTFNESDVKRTNTKFSSVLYVHGLSESGKNRCWSGVSRFGVLMEGGAVDNPTGLMSFISCGSATDRSLQESEQELVSFLGQIWLRP